MELTRFYIKYLNIYIQNKNVKSRELDEMLKSNLPLTLREMKAFIKALDISNLRFEKFNKYYEVLFSLKKECNKEEYNHIFDDYYKSFFKDLETHTTFKVREFSSI